MLSNTCKYGIRAVIYLAMNSREGEKIGIKQISRDLNIPTPFLGKILQSLAKQKLLSSTKGPHGGFGLGKEPDSISLLDIVLIIDGDDIFDRCLLNIISCKDYKKDKTPCPVHKKFSPNRNKLRELFEKETIGSIIKEIKKSKDIQI
jgi:Rrf2 family transcriptional regulator, iron-sulfur cluster assembly transcription factor